MQLPCGVGVIPLTGNGQGVGPTGQADRIGATSGDAIRICGCVVIGVADRFTQRALAVGTQFIKCVRYCDTVSARDLRREQQSSQRN